MAWHWQRGWAGWGNTSFSIFAFYGSTNFRSIRNRREKKKNKSKAKQDRGKYPAARRWLKWHSTWQEESQTHCGRKGFLSPAPWSKQGWLEQAAQHHILLEPAPAQGAPGQSSPLAGSALLLHVPGGPHTALASSPGKHPRVWWELGALVLLLQSRGRKMCHFLLACLSMWLQSWLSKCCRWESNVSLWVWEWSWGAP